MNRNTFRIVAAALVAAALAWGWAGCAPPDENEGGGKAEFPASPITIVCPPKPGGTSDTITRALAAAAKEQFGQNVMVVNKEGGGNVVGLRYGADARPDGYTVTYMVCEIAIIPHRPDLDAQDKIDHSRFEPLALLNRTPAVLTVSAKSGWNTFADFEKAARERKLTVGTSGPWSIWELAPRMLASELGVSFEYIAHHGASEAVAALRGDHVQAVCVAPAEVLPGLRDGSFKALTVFDPERDPALPDVPTTTELGKPNLTISAWGGLGVPKGTPEAVRAVLAGKFKKAFDTPAFQEPMAKANVSLKWLDAPAYARFLDDESARFKALAGAVK
ncbi:MAG: tripartite tricarboxylate transporter substrate binding protein [Planctomycetes bacterium]|nr:tripartite tricarboxylate transporter substrate binding protein [Planctomycetota bacterium]